MTYLHERIKQLRKALDLTQQEFADKIGTTRNNIAGYETGRRLPSEAAINLIIAKLNVSETWLRTGAGGDEAMFVQRSRDDELSSFVNELLAGESTDFRRRLVTALSRLKPEQWDALAPVALELMKNPAPSPAPAASAPDYDAEARAEAAAYYHQLLLEKKAAAESSVSTASASSDEKPA